MISLLSTYTDFAQKNPKGLYVQNAHLNQVLNFFYNALLYIGGFGIVIGLILVAVSFAVGNPRKRQEGKEQLANLLFWGIVLFAMGGISSGLYAIITSLTF